MLATKTILKLGTIIGNYYAETIEWDEFHSDCGRKRIAKYFDLYWQYRSKNKESIRTDVKYFRISTSSRCWFNINVGSNGSKSWFKISCKYIRIGKWFKSLKFVQKCKDFRSAFDHADYRNYISNWPSPEEAETVAPLKKMTIFEKLRFAYRAANCKHKRMQYDCDICNDSCSEYFQCPDCGFQCTIHNF